MKTALAGLVALTLSSCATLSTANMTEHCREDYNFCLNGCRGPVNLDRDHPNLDTRTPSCTEQCNQTAKFCR